ncbi:MAG TPA: penicillin-binding transpeptidase domain-containing protein [Blastocatellia bacterium]|nr:penicillin-binding transpeptidase domain-containing protein [Blastocatellia bacterium]
MNFPFIATLVFLGGIIFLLLSLFLSTYRFSRKPPAPVADLPDDFGPKLTSNRLRYVRWAFAVLVIVAFGFHVYWGLFAAGPLGENKDFAHLKNTRDQRNRRDAEANLRGWIFDRHKDYRRCLAKYRYLNGKIIRDYPLGAAASHLIGYSGLARGDAELERAVVHQPPPKEAEQSWWQKWFSSEPDEPKVEAGRDLQLTVDYDLQKAAFEQLNSKGHKGAVVMLNPQTGEVLALASNPSFDPDDINNDVKWNEISRDLKNRPLLNRALNEYYPPGSTLKTLTAAAALDVRISDTKTFLCQGGGWTPPGSGRPIQDDEGHVHGNIAMEEAYVKSCNQYFAQLGVEVERQRMGEAAARFGFKVFADPADSIGTGATRGLWNTDNKILNDVLAPLNSTFVNGNKITKYDLALESIGQGYVQLTPFQMAFVAAAAANTQGNVMRPMMEMGRQPAVLSQAMTPETARRLRIFMTGVVERGTAAGVFGTTVRQAGLTAGGKTGTAQREVPVIDPKTGQPATYKDARGKVRIKRENRIDSWFIGFAPVNNPTIAWAVMVEGGGYGSKIAAPIAANLLVKAKELGLLKADGTVAPSASPAVAASPRASRTRQPR